MTRFGENFCESRIREAHDVKSVWTPSFPSPPPPRPLCQTQSKQTNKENTPTKKQNNNNIEASKQNLKNTYPKQKQTNKHFHKHKTKHVMIIIEMIIMMMIMMMIIIIHLIIIAFKCANRDFYNSYAEVVWAQSCATRQAHFTS